MSMNYVGSISLLDRGEIASRGDSPAQAILDKNARSVAQRIADETREELEKVLERVDHIYDSYENSMELIFQTQQNAKMEYVNDIAELEEIMKDQIKKRKYQQGLTIFIVGYENVCGQRLKLLQTVNEFFMENSKSYEEEDWFPKTPDLDIDHSAETMEESLVKADDLANRLGELNQEMISWLSNYAINKASTKGKKKLEKALEKAKEDMVILSEKLHNLQTELEDKDKKSQDLLKLLEVKNLENQKYKTAADIAKKNMADLEIEHAIVKEDLDKRKTFMKDLQKKLNRAENELSQNNMLQDMQANRFSDENQETQKKMQELQEAVDKNKGKMEEVKREIEKFHEQQIFAITKAHAVEIEDMKNQYDEELKKAKVDIDETQKKIEEAESAAKSAEEEADSLRHNLIELQLRAASADTRSSELADLDEDPSRQGSQQDSRPSTKNSKQSSKGKPLPSKSPKRDGRSGKDMSESTSQDEGGDPNTAHAETRQSKRSKSTLEPVQEGEVTEFSDAYDLKDEVAWTTLPVEQMHSRYVQYRKLTRARLDDLEEQLDVTVAKTQRKVNNLKSQFQEHKGKWESERKVLIEQVEQAQKLQTEAEKEADSAMTQLEEFINEQERLEDEEEGKRTDIVKTVTRPARREQKPDEAGDRKSVSSDTQTQKEPDSTEKTISEERPSEEHTEPELSRLMQQTDDAKSQRQRSETLSEIDSDVAPWMRKAPTPQNTPLNNDVFATPERTSMSKQGRRSGNKQKRINSEQSELMASDVSQGKDFDERDEDDLEADVEFSTDDVKSVSHKQLKSRNSRRRSSVSKTSLSRTESVHGESRTSTKRESRHASEIEETDTSQLKRGSKSRSSTKHSSQKSRRSSFREPSTELEPERVDSAMSFDRVIDEEGVSQKGSQPEDEERSIRESLQREAMLKSQGSSRASMHWEEAVLSRRGSLIGEDFDRSRRGSIQNDEVKLSRRGSVHWGEDENIKSRRGSLQRDGSFRSRESKRASLISKTSTQEYESEEDMDDEFRRDVRSRGKSHALKRSPDHDLSGGRETAPPHFKQVQEMNSRITGAMSAPPAVEDGVEVADKEGALHRQKLLPISRRGSRSRSPRPGSINKRDGSQLLQPAKSSAYAIEEISESSSSKSRSPQSDRGKSTHSRQAPHSGSNSGSRSPGQSRSAWHTPRIEKPSSGKMSGSSRQELSPRSCASPGLMVSSSRASPQSADSRRNISSRKRDVHLSPDDVLPATQAGAIDSIKEMIGLERLSSFQTRTLESVREALHQINKDQENLSNQQLERTLTIISLASQLTEESLKIGVLPDSIFETFAALNSRSMSDMTHGEDDYIIDDASTVDFLRPITKASIKDEQMYEYLQELSHHSLKSLPPLDGVLTSSQSHFVFGREGASISQYKPPSAPHRLVSYVDDRATTFDTDATFGSSRMNTITSLPSKQPSRLRQTKILRSRGVDVQTLDYLDMQTQTSPIPQPPTPKADTPESDRGSSAKSRASLRSQYKTKLEETRLAVEERRAKSPAISIPSQRSLEEDQLIDEDEDVALLDEMKSREPTMDISTSPPPQQRRSISMSRHSTKPDDPLVQEYLKTYDSILSFRDALSKILQDREMLQASQILTDLETAIFNREDKLEPQVEKMTFNAYYLFEEIIAVLGSILYTDEREPAVSSMLVSREGVKPMTREKSADSVNALTRMSRVSSRGSPALDKSLLIELQENYEKLQKQFEIDSKKHEEQIRHNTVVMMEMQDTINELQRELGNIGRSASRIRQSSDLTTPQGQAESAIMFTRLDSERNAKIMKRAVNDQKLDPDQYKDVMAKMEDYVSIPAKRLAHLVRKYVHHCRMKEIEESVKKSKSLDENVFEVLDKMENFQNKRAKQWAEGMDHMGNDRLRFANILMETLEDIEQQSGIFLIKPMYSFKGRDIKERYGGKLARPIRPHRNISPTREISSFAPAPTPASNIRGLTRGHISSSLAQHPEEDVRYEPPRPLAGDDTGITGAGMVWVGTVPRDTWNIGSSQVRTSDDPQNPNMMNTPRILELDINRMMIGQNNISTRITSPGVSDDRLVNASQNNLRSYVTVNRPAPGPGQPRASTFSSVKDNVPPSSPTAHQYTPSPTVQKRVRMSDSDVGRVLNSTPPLPPISGGSRGRQSPDDQSQSISATSIRPQVLEIVSPLK